jgi:hypothetical protein
MVPRDHVRKLRLLLEQERGFQLRELPAGNFELPGFPGLLLKDSYWRWTDASVAISTCGLLPPAKS